MTAIFDSLAVIGFRAKDQISLMPLVNAVYDEAISQLDAIGTRIQYEKYAEENEAMYMKLYQFGEFEMKMGFIGHCHTWIDHTDQHHCRCFHHSFNYLVHKIKEVLLAKSSINLHFTMKKIHWTARKRYAEILEQLRLIIKSGRVICPYYLDKPTKKWLGKVEPFRYGAKPTETEKIMKDKKLMRAIQKARKKGSKTSPYKPLVESPKKETKK